MLLQKSLKKLTASSGATNMRLWGLIHGTEKDYYVAEGVVEGGDAPEDEPNFEARGSGVNQFAYYVCTDVASGNWSALPDLSPSDLAAAKSIKYHFTGDLERKIITNPFYFKLEKNFLRAQIARISHATSLAPAHSFKLSGDEEEGPRYDVEPNVAEDEENPIILPSMSEMAKKENWVYLHRNILNCNRITHGAVEANEDDPDFDAEAAEKKMVAADPFEERLKCITKDKHIKGGMPTWVIRSVGDKTDYA